MNDYGTPEDIMLAIHEGDLSPFAFKRYLKRERGIAWDEAVESLDRHHGDIFPGIVDKLDKRNPYRG